MPSDPALFLRQTIERELPLLRAITEDQSAAPPEKPGGWTRKQELGHLLDSAINNHLRFMRAAIEGAYDGPGYAQDEWVRLHGWNELPWTTLVDYWEQHNALIERLITRIPKESLDNKCIVSSAAPVTLLFLMEDYVFHMQHHIDHLLSRPQLTQYPGALLGV
jgi:hypothetical protein